MMNRDEGCRRWINYLQIKFLILTLWAWAAIESNYLVQLSTTDSTHQFDAFVLLGIVAECVSIFLTFACQIEHNFNRLKLILYCQGFNMLLAVIMVCKVNTQLTLLILVFTGLGGVYKFEVASSLLPCKLFKTDECRVDGSKYLVGSH